MKPRLGKHSQAIVFINTLENSEGSLSKISSVDLHLSHNFDRQTMGARDDE